MVTELCIRCHKNPIEVASRSLCKNCHNYVMRKFKNPKKVQEYLDQFTEKKYTSDVAEILDEVEARKDPNSLGVEGILRHLKEQREKKK